MTPTEFTNDQFASAYPEGIERHYWSMARNSIIANFLKKQHLAEKKMLEIGCGRGIVLRALCREGFDCYGVDLANEAVPKDLAGRLIYGMSFEHIDPILIASVEVVLLFDVIEHIEDEKDFLERVQRTFPNLTHIVVTVPARMELWSNYDTYYGHFRRYTRATLKSIAKACGFEMRDASYFFHALFLPGFIFTLFGLTRATTVVSPVGLLVAAHRIIASIFELEHKILPASFVGTSIIAVLTPRKKGNI